MRMFNGISSDATSNEVAGLGISQVAVNFSVDSVMKGGATVTLQGYQNGAWRDLLVLSAMGTLRVNKGGVYTGTAERYRLQATQVTGMLTANMTWATETQPVTNPPAGTVLPALSITVTPTEGGTYQLPDTAQELILMLDHAQPIQQYTLVLGDASAGRDRQSLLVRADRDIANLTLTGVSEIDNPSDMLFAKSSIIFIRVSPDVWSRVV